MDFIEIKDFCLSKDTFNRKKMQPTKWKKTLYKDSFRLYKELLQINMKDSPTWKLGQRLEKGLQKKRMFKWLINI